MNIQKIATKHLIILLSLLMILSSIAPAFAEGEPPEPTEEITNEDVGEVADEDVDEVTDEDVDEDVDENVEEKTGTRLRAPSRSLVFDEENIEKFTAELVRGAEKQSNGTYMWTPTNSNSDHRIVWKITYAFSGVGEIAAGDVEIRIPKQMIRDRNGDFADYYDIAVPPEEEAEDDTKWVMKEDGDYIIIYNYTEISAAETGTIEAAYLTSKLTTHYEDMSSTSAFTADLTVHNESTDVTATATAPAAIINTAAEIMSTDKREPELYKTWDSSFGAEPADADDYLYIVWAVRTKLNKNNTQPYDFTLQDDFEDGDVVAYKLDGQNTWSPVNNEQDIYQPGNREDERWDYILTRHSKEDFSGMDYTVYNNITAIVHPADGIDPDTSDSDREPFIYTRPVYKRPPGHFYAEKFGQYTSTNSTGLTETSAGVVKDSEDISDYRLAEFKSGEIDVIDNPNLRYYSFLRGYPYPWTLPENSDGLDPDEYGTVPVDYEFKDEKVFIEDNDPLGAGDYEISCLHISSEFLDGVFDEDEMLFKEAPLPDSKLTPETDLFIYAKKNGDNDWVKVARYSFRTKTFSELKNDYVDSTTGNIINFKPGILGYRWTASNAFYCSRINTYPVIRLFRTQKVLDDIGDSNKIRLKNTAFISVTGQNNSPLFPQDALNSSGELFASRGMTGTDYIAGIQKTSHISKYDTGMRTNKAKKQFSVSWRIAMSESYTDNAGQHYVEQDGGTFYDLCPAGSHADTSSVIVYKEDNTKLDPSDYTISVKHNFRGTGRDLLVIKIKDPGDCYSFTFDTIHEWEDLKQTTFRLLNSVAYQTGNRSIAEGYADDGGRGADRSLLKDLDPDNDDKRFLYSQDWRSVDIVTSTSSSLNKKVRDEYDNAYSYKTFTRVNGRYFYRLRMQADSSTRSKDIILFDSLENYANAEVSSDFHGTLQDVDVSGLTDVGIDAVVYYSLMEDMDIYDHHDLDEMIGENKVWLTEEEIGDISRAKAVAIDCRKTIDGEDFVLQSGTPIFARLEMKAPSEGMELGRIPYAYNNVFMSQTEINEFDVEHEDLIHQDYTKIGYKVTGSLDFRKVSKTDHDTGIKGISFRVFGTSDYETNIDNTYKSDSSGVVSIKDLEQGTYEVKELGGSKYWVVDRTTHHLTIDANGNASIDLPDEDGYYWENEKRIMGDLHLRKESRGIPGRPGESIPDTEFVLFGTSAYGNDISMTVTSNAAGVVRFKEVEKGTYTLRESRANDRYIRTAEDMTVTVDSSGTVSVNGLEPDESMMYTILNDHRYHSFDIYKFDAENESLVIPGTEFTLKGISDLGTRYNTTVATNEFGKAEFTDIESGTYILTETKAAERYLLDPTEHAVVIDADGNVTIAGTELLPGRNSFKLTNERLNDGKITITKRWADGKTNSERPVPKIHLTTTEPEGAKEAYAVYDSEEKSLIFFKDVPGKYGDGQTIGNKTYWNNMENRAAPWYQYPYNFVYQDVEYVTFRDVIRPATCEKWFYEFNDNQEHPLKIDMTNLDMSRCTTASFMFGWSCPTEIIGFENMDLRSLENGDHMFYDAGGASSGKKNYFTETGIHLATTTPALTNCKDMFSARSVSVFDIPNMDFSGWNRTEFQDLISNNYVDKLYINLENAKAPKNCDGLFNSISSREVEFNLRNFDTSETTSMSRMFQNCKGDGLQDVENFDVSKCTSFASMFNNCEDIRSLDLSGWELNESGGINTTTMMGSCDSLESVNLSGWDFSLTNSSPLNSMLPRSLKQLDLSGCKVTPAMGPLVQYMSGLESIDVTDMDVSGISVMYNWFYNCHNLKEITGINTWDFSNVYVTASMFNSCTSLKKIDLNGCRMDLSSPDAMFSGCSSMEEVLISDLHIKSNTSNGLISGMFRGCTAEHIDLSNAGLLNLNSAFQGMTYVKHIDLSNVEVPDTQSLYNTFQGCTSLEEVDLRNAELDNVTDLRNTFSGCSELRYVVFPADMTLTDVTAEKAQNMFAGCTKLETIYAPTFDLSGSAVMFTSCPDLTGGSGTAWTSENTGTEYACIDGERAGYFTDPSLAPRARRSAKRTIPQKTEEPKPQEAPAAPDLSQVEEHTEALARAFKNSLRSGSEHEYVTDDNNWVKNGDVWTYTFDVFDDEALYYAYEEDLTGYHVFNDADNPIVINDGEITKQATFTNRTSETGGFMLSKTLAGDNLTEFDKGKTFGFDITLTSANEDLISGIHTFGDVIFTDGEATVFLGQNNTLTISGIPSGTGYTVTERSADGFTGSITNSTGTITTDGMTRVAATNTKINTDTATLELCKVVDSPTKQGTFDFTVHISELEPLQNYKYGTKTFTADAGGYADVNVSLGHNGTCAFPYLPEGARYSVEEAANDEFETSYSQEDSADLMTFVKASGKGLSTKTETLASGSDVTVTFTNKMIQSMEESTDIVLVKKDQSTKEVLSGAEFTLSGTADNGDTIDITETSDSAGIIRFRDIGDGEYILQEKKPPVGYYLDYTSRTVKVVNGHPMYYGQGELDTVISKTENVVDENTFNIASDGLNSGVDTITIPGATKLRVRIVYATGNFDSNWIAIYDKTVANPSRYNTSYSVSGTLSTPGYIRMEKTFEIEGDTAKILFYIGNSSYIFNHDAGYYAEITGYDEDMDLHELSITGLNQNAQGQFEVFNNSTRTYTVEFNKVSSTDPDNGLYGAVFELRQGSNVYEAESDKNGHVVFEGITSSSNCTLREITPPRGYELSDEVYTVSLDYNTYKGTIKDSTGSAIPKVNGVYQVKNAPEKRDISIDKTVRGGMGDKNKNFEFSVSIRSAEPSKTYNMIYSDGRTDTLTTEADGTVTKSFTLKHGQEMTIKDLPYESVVSFTEAASDHAPSHTAVMDDLVVSQGNSEAGTAMSTREIILRDDCEVSYTNRLETVLATGLKAVGKSLLILAAAAFVIIAHLRKKPEAR